LLLRDALDCIKQSLPAADEQLQRFLALNVGNHLRVHGTPLRRPLNLFASFCIEKA